MKKSLACPKCGGREIVRAEGNVGAYGVGSNIMVGATIFSAIKLHRYICCSCGYTEHWVDREDLPKVRERCERARPG